jgi:hypothetical protein
VGGRVAAQHDNHRPTIMQPFHVLQRGVATSGRGRQPCLLFISGGCAASSTRRRLMYRPERVGPRLARRAASADPRHPKPQHAAHGGCDRDRPDLHRRAQEETAGPFDSVVAPKWSPLCGGPGLWLSEFWVSSPEEGGELLPAQSRVLPDARPCRCRSFSRSPLRSAKHTGADAGRQPSSTT